MDQGTGARLRAAREERGATPDEVAAAIGIPPEAVTDIEAGDALRHYGPGLAAAWTWAVGRHLGVAIDHELATWQPPHPDELAQDAGTAGATAGWEPPAGGAGPTPDRAGPAPDSAGPTPDGAGPVPDIAARGAPTGPAAGVEPPAEPAVPEDAGWWSEPAMGGDDRATGAGDPVVGAAGDALAGAGAAGQTGRVGDDPDEPAREPKVEPGWLNDFDEDPLEDFDPATADSPGEPSPADRAARPDVTVDAEADWWDEVPPSPDEAGPPAGRDDVVPRPAGSSAGLWDAADPRGEAAGGSQAGDSGATTRFDLDDERPGAVGSASHPRVPQPPAGDDAAPPRAEDTGELPSGESVARVLAYTEGEEVPRLEPRSRLRTALAVLVALVLLIGAGVGAGALAAQLFDDPAASEGDAADQDAGTGPDARDGDEPAVNAGSDQASDDGSSADQPAGDTTSDDAPTGDDTGFGPATGDQRTTTLPDDLAGDAGAAADPADTTVQVLNGSGDPELYQQAREVLAEIGYRIIASGGAASHYEQTTVFVTDGYADEAAALAERDPRFRNRQPNDPEVQLSQEVELHVVVGEQWADSTDG